MPHHLTLLQLNPFELSVDRDGWWFEHSLSKLQFSLSAQSSKKVSWPWLSLLQGRGSLTMGFTGKFVCIWLIILSSYDSIPLSLVLIERDGGLSTMCHNCWFHYQQRLLKKFCSLGYLCSEDGVV